LPDLLLPPQLDNRFRGWRAALWLYVPVLAIRLLIAGRSILDSRDVATRADGIPLDQMNATGANEAVALFALLSWSHLIIALVGLLALVRYRAMIPLMYLLFLLIQLGNRVLNALHPTAQDGAATVSGISTGFLVTSTLLAVTVIGFILSLIPRRGTS
jgi:hypothetical protein